MPVARFPNPRETGPEGLVAIGGDLSPETLLLAYRQGIFPWPIEGAPTHTWFCPPERGVLEFKSLHIPRSLALFLKKTPYRFSLDQEFAQVISRCAAAKRPDQPGTWISDEIMDAYRELHHLGHAHSVEAWDKNGMLVGGLYGIYIDGMFAGESMFHLKPNASKLALLHLIEHLKTRGIEWMDTQVSTPHMELLGAKLIPRDDFLTRLSRTHERFRGVPF